MNRPRVHGGSIGFNLGTAAGRAVQHLLGRSTCLSYSQGEGWEIVEHADNGRSLVVHPQFAAWCSDGEAALILFAESLLGRTSVVVGWVLDALDEDERQNVMVSVAIAAGLGFAEAGS